MDFDKKLFFAAQAIGLLTLLGSWYFIPKIPDSYLWVGKLSEPLTKKIFSGFILFAIISYISFIYYFTLGSGQKYFQKAPLQMQSITLGSFIFMLCSTIWAPATYVLSQNSLSQNSFSQNSGQMSIIAVGLIGTAIAAIWIWKLVKQLPDISQRVVIALGIVVAHTVFGDAGIWLYNLYNLHAKVQKVD